MARGLAVVVILGWIRVGSRCPPESLSAEVDAGANLPSFAKDAIPFLTKHCYGCHGKRESEGDLTLDSDRNESAVEKNRKVWEKRARDGAAGDAAQEPATSLATRGGSGPSRD